MNNPKFRAWDKSVSHGYFIDVEQLTYDEFGELSHVSGYYTDDESNEVILGIDEFELMQFTGLLDKNGKEIYEGDIIKIKGLVGVCVVAGGVSPRYDTIGFMLYRYKKGKMYGSTSPSWVREKEIIGNIYENPELLKN